MAKVVFLNGLPSEIVNEINSYAPSHFQIDAIGRESSEAQRVEAVAGADFLLCYRLEPSDDVLQSAKKCQLVQLLAAGYEKTNLKLLRDLGIPCCNNGGANSWAVSDHAVLLMLSLYKKLLQASIDTTNGKWDDSINGQNTFEMAGKVIGILGMGNIGRQVAKRVQGFDSVVQYYDVNLLDDETNKSLNVCPVSIDTLFETSDIVTCHISLNENTHHIVDRDKFALMKRSAILINTSRGSVVDEAALIDTLSNGSIAGAGIDVFENEPVDPGNPLLSFSNVVSTPHMAGTTWDTWRRRAEFGFGNMDLVLQGKSPISIVNDFGD